MVDVFIGINYWVIVVVFEKVLKVNDLDCYKRKWK